MKFSKSLLIAASSFSVFAEASVPRLQAPLGLGSGGNAAKQPNILFIISDD